MKKYTAMILAILLALSVLLTACGGGANTNTNTNTDSPSQTTETGNKTDSKSETTPPVTAVDKSGYEFSERDQDPSYDEVTATVTLADSGSTADGSGVTVEGSSITVTAAGTYVISGNFSSGSVTVAAGEEDKVQLVLSGVSVTNPDGPAIYVKSADKVFLTLAEGTENTLSDGSDAAATDDDKNLDGAVFSRADLTINGSGSLTVHGNSKHGVVSKDDLVITGGTVTVAARNVALNGKDCVKITAAAVNLTAGTDGIRSDNDEDADRGYVYIQSGTITVDAGTDGIQAKTDLYVAGGTLTISSGNDGARADETLTVNGGTLVITAAEGLEATVVTINDGDISISASDDGINAAQKSSAYTPLVEINGGKTTIVMGTGDTDGVDSNGNIVINGGTVSVTGNSAFDYEGSGDINGGTVIVNGQQVTTLPNQMMGGMMGPGGQPGGQPGGTPPGGQPGGQPGGTPPGGQPGGFGHP